MGQWVSLDVKTGRISGSPPEVKTATEVKHELNVRATNDGGTSDATLTLAAKPKVN
jgi:hypothetical protein